MGKSRIDAWSLFLALAAGAFLLGVLNSFGWIVAWLSGIGGLILLFVLFSYDQEGVRSGFQSLAFSGVCGFALMLIVAAFFQSGVLGNIARDRVFGEYLPIAWLCATFVFIVIDRARMGPRFQESLGPRSLGIRPAARYEPPALAYEPPPPAAQEPEPVYARPESAAPQPQPEPQPVPVAPESPEPVAAASAPERAVPVQHRKETSIYVNLVGEGVSMLRTVRAEHMGKDFYLITEPMPEGESWQFTTGQIVRCKKKNLSHGKALVAMEEAPRAS